MEVQRSFFMHTHLIYIWTQKSLHVNRLMHVLACKSHSESHTVCCTLRRPLGPLAARQRPLELLHQQLNSAGLLPQLLRLLRQTVRLLSTGTDSVSGSGRTGGQTTDAIDPTDVLRTTSNPAQRSGGRWRQVDMVCRCQTRTGCPHA